MNEKAQRRFFAKLVVEPNGCWSWAGSRTRNGYGTFYMAPKREIRSPVLAHRASYEFFVGPIPEGLTLDHLCRVRHCVNPAHLEPVTQHENTIRGGVLRRKSVCKRGHRLTPENLYVRTSKSGAVIRKCRQCIRDGARERKQRSTLYERSTG